MQFILSILVIGIIIAFHELGHFLVAKLSGIGVVEFALGMGPVLLHKRVGETVYSLRAVPIGGFCAMYGEPSAESQDKTPDKNNRRKPDYKTDWDESRSYLSASRWKQVMVALAGPGFNILLAFLCAVCLAGLPSIYTGQPEITGLGPVTVAQDAGIETGDIITNVNGREVLMSLEYSNYIGTHPATGLGYDLTVYRPSEGAYHTYHLIPDPDTGLVGITFRGTQLTGPFRLFEGGYRILRSSVITSLDSIGMLFRGDAGLTDMSSIVGITVVMGDTVSEAADVQAEGTENGSETAVLQAVLSMALLISVALAVTNMLPLPALDGGRALISIGEGITGKRLPEKAALWINGVSMLALMGLMLVIMIGDAVKIIQRLI